eukprot:TRINITY_DN5876_c0_g3_i1.p1 TRINITY_DN5876_c0_g3~~TRINITY_DN5876_c0_g3_i1.p1  ORF type:complete len:524 (+),score=121.41 TRINITY_DN5876_c0_g3_i1:100-1671(+)
MRGAPGQGRGYSGGRTGEGWEADKGPGLEGSGRTGSPERGGWRGLSFRRASSPTPGAPQPPRSPRHRVRQSTEQAPHGDWDAARQAAEEDAAAGVRARYSSPSTPRGEATPDAARGARPRAGSGASDDLRRGLRRPSSPRTDARPPEADAVEPPSPPTPRRRASLSQLHSAAMEEFEHVRARLRPARRASESPGPPQPAPVPQPAQQSYKQRVQGFLRRGRRDTVGPQQQQQQQPQQAGPPQRLRGESFMIDCDTGGAAVRGRRRAPSMIQSAGDWMLPPPRPSDVGRYVVVLDLDETLIYARDGPLYARPGLQALLEMLDQRAEPVVWTAGLRGYAQAVLANVDKRGIVRHCVYRHKKWFTGQAGYQKDLTLLGRPLDKVVIVENTPDCIRGNPRNGILVADYEGGELADNTIEILHHFLVSLFESGEPVPRFLPRCPLLSRRRVATDLGDTSEVFFLDSFSGGQPALRVNRDLSPDQRPPSPRRGSHPPPAPVPAAQPAPQVRRGAGRRGRSGLVCEMGNI